MLLNRFLVLGIAILLTSPAVLHAGIFYDCTVEQKRGPDGWISPRVGIVVGESNKAQIIDALTMHFETGPREARVREKGETMRLNWSFTALSDDSSQMIPNFQFSATLNKKTGVFKITGKPVRFPQRVSGVGSCVVRNDLNTRQLNRLLRSNSG